METWKLGNLATWQLGNLDTWKLGNLETWKLGILETWKPGNLETLNLSSKVLAGVRVRTSKYPYMDICEQTRQKMNKKFEM